MYDVKKTLFKGAEPPAAVAVVSAVIYYGARALGQEIEAEHALMVATALYGIYRGVRNLIKNWRKQA